ncbi:MULTISPECIES: VC0807 family protein [Thermocrispum]|uniref:VC0807 family protein n=1 Tax=Thermocrispum TaxID=37924 RepID=UPI00042023BD|nr:MULTISPECIES: VC0807 family protein [Thermocrispum]
MSGANSDAKPLLTLLVWDAGFPLAVYYGMRLAGADERLALLTGAICAAARLAFVAVLKRSFDGFAALLAAVLGVGLLLTFISGDEKFLLVKESFSVAAAAVILLVSCFTSKPLVLVVARAGSSQAHRAEIDRLCASIPQFRRAFVLMTAVWGVALLVEAALRVLLVYLVPADVMVALSLVMLLGVVALLSVWTVWYSSRVQARYEVGAAQAAG